MSAIAIALVVLADTSAFMTTCTGPTGRLGLVFVGPYLAAALWCLWWSSWHGT